MKIENIEVEVFEEVPLAEQVRLNLTQDERDLLERKHREQWPDHKGHTIGEEVIQSPIPMFVGVTCSCGENQAVRMNARPSRRN